MNVGLDYGYRSRCCYAPVKLGRKKVKNTDKKIQIWVCTKCKTRDVNLVEYTGKQSSESIGELNSNSSFITDEDEAI